MSTIRSPCPRANVVTRRFDTISRVDLALAKGSADPLMAVGTDHDAAITKARAQRGRVSLRWFSFEEEGAHMYTRASLGSGRV